MLLLALFRAPVAHLDRASDYGSEGLGFDSLRVRHFFRCGGTACATPRIRLSVAGARRERLGGGIIQMLDDSLSAGGDFLGDDVESRGELTGIVG